MTTDPERPGAAASDGPGPVRLTPALLQLDDLLAELRSRALAAQEGQDRMARLLEAVVSVGSDLELHEVLTRITRSACELVGARYGALGVLDRDGQALAEFVTHGLTPAERAALGSPPHGHGLLGLLIHEPRTLRVPDIAGHPASYGVPPGHPAMRTFIGTPVRTRTAVFGNLYLAEKDGGREFTAEDEAFLEALASAAGVAVENARLYDLSRRRARWGEALRDLGEALLSDQGEDVALQGLVDAVRAVCGADRVAVALREDDRLVVRPVGDGARLDPTVRAESELEGAPWDALRERRRPLLRAARSWGPAPTDERTDEPPDVRLVEAVAAALAHLLGSDPRGDVAALPLTVAGPELGLLLVTWPSGESDSTEAATELVAVAQQAGVALVAGRARRDQARMVLLDDRARIARDMHDHVIQRLFAAGLSLQAASGLVTDDALRGRLGEAVDELDTAITEIRTAIFPLQDRRAQGVRSHLERLVRVLSHGAPAPPRVHVGPGAEALPADLVDDVVAVVREGVANAVRHAGADRIEAHVDVADGQVVVRVEDDGAGVAPDRPRSGLHNLADRATRRGGHLEVSGRTPSGTRLEWRVPLAVGRR